jgi:hypothetical protein
MARLEGASGVGASNHDDDATSASWCMLMQLGRREYGTEKSGCLQVDSYLARKAQQTEAASAAAKAAAAVKAAAAAAPGKAMVVPLSFERAQAHSCPTRAAAHKGFAAPRRNNAPFLERPPWHQPWRPADAAEPGRRPAADAAAAGRLTPGSARPEHSTRLASAAPGFAEHPPCAVAAAS